ncbi:hypothetical protein V8G54_034318 [Vigna mungo]|uniref:SWIM-type domain-containing protein n=1 Tax=Vigna mungo TaxID=3915 RepID=A0AAQ3RKN6_VIGMU
MEDHFEVVFHHGDRFKKDGPLRYEGESTSLAFNPDMWNDKLEALTDDRGALHMMNLARLNGQVHLFVVHLVSELEVIHFLKNVPHNIGEEEVEPVMHVSNEDGGCEEGHEECQEVGDEGKMDADVVHVEIEAECDVGESERDDVVQGQIETECHVSESKKDDDICDGDVRSWSSSGEDDNVHCNVDVPSMDDLVDCDIQEEVGHGVGNSFGEIEVDVEDDAPSWTPISDSDEDVGINIEKDRGLSDDNWESEELLSGGESDGEDDDQESYGKFVTFSMPKTMVDYKWDLGTYFANKQDILDAIKTYAVENGRNLSYVKNDKKRIRVKCVGAKGKCPWMAYYGYMNVVRTWQLRTIVDNHTCSREHKVKLMNSKWLSKRLEKTVRENPKVKVGEIRDKISRKWNVGVSKSMAFRAKSIASDHVDGSFKEQYKRIYDYANELLARNPGSTVKVEVEENVDGHIFKRFYVCLKACKDSFVFCRPIIGLDEAFLKGKYGGELLTAIARDANDQMLPVAHAIVEVENKETWKWFLELLVEDITDIHIRSTKAFQEVLPIVDQRFCVRHLYANFRKKFPGKQLKRMMWKAATATHPQAWETEMKRIKEVNLEAFQYLIKIPPKHWSRSWFTTTSKCDTLVNNMSEAFNSVLVHTRSKPIITMLEEIRLYLMNKWAKNRTKSQSISGSICPKIKSRLNKESQLTKYWIPSWSGLKLFEVRHISQAGDKFTVDIDKFECTCRKWAISGIPCCHALAAMKFLNLDAEEFIPVCFRKSTYEEMYSSVVYPINGENMWQITPYNEVLPPKKRTLPGRPKKKRRLQEWELVRNETRMRKGGIQKRCGICKELGHNRTSCQKSSIVMLVMMSKYSDIDTSLL